MINNHKAPIKLKAPSGEIIDDDTFGEWKIHSTMKINLTLEKFVQWKEANLFLKVLIYCIIVFKKQP